jgi:hypothetical protein
LTSAEYPWWQPLKPDDILERQFRHLKNETHCDDLACLRGKSAAEIAMAAQNTYRRGYFREKPSYGHGDFYYGPSVDGKVIQGLPSREFAAGNFAPVSAYL